MCGIVGYIGTQEASPILLNGLAKLEYRGYDSAGVAVLHDGKIDIKKAEGRLKNLVDLTENGTNVKGNIGIGHTRWATHGAPSDTNAHPHMSMGGRFAVVHNGIIENYNQLKRDLQEKGYVFVSQTDTEVVAHLFDHLYTGDLVETGIKVAKELEGAYALGVVCTEAPGCFLAIRKESPLIVGLGEGENFIASDNTALLKYTKNVHYLENNEFVLLTADKVTVYNDKYEVVEKEVHYVDMDENAAEKGGYEHFMLKEMLEQPKSVANTISPRLKNGEIVLDDFHLTREKLESFRKIYIVACGSSYHVAAVAKYVIEDLTRIPVEIDIASEFRYRQPILDDKSLLIVISQSGTTADTIEAMREGKKHGAHVLAIVNVIGSTIANEADDVLYTWAGPEIAVATTKAYSTQLSVIYLLAIRMAELIGTITDEERTKLIEGLKELPAGIEKALTDIEKIKEYANALQDKNQIFFIGRNLDYAVALEGSLKLKEISYIHSEAYAGGELKHGTISLIEDGTLVVVLGTYSRLNDKILSNLEEVKARGAVILTVTTEDDNRFDEKSDYVLRVPKTHTLLQPSLTVIPLQLFAYYVAAARGCSIDTPRNLAKSVTVE